MADHPKVLLLGMQGTSRLAAQLARALGAELSVRHEALEGAGAPAPERLEALVAACEPELVAVLAPGAAPGTAAPLLRAFAADHPGLPVLVAMDGGRPEEIFELLELGACDFLAPPLEPAQVLPRVWRVLRRGGESRRLKDRLKESFGLRQLIGESPAFVEEVRKIPLVARWDVGVLLCGETGTGKDLCGRAIHYLSPRSGGPFVALNCGAMPVELMENELFGHVRAAFTGAGAPAIGLVQEAEGGTLFLDEVDALPAAAQTKLLRFLQDKEFRPLGSTKARRADVRIVAATNSDPEQAVEQGRLRRDLYYRLNVVRLELPPLRRRREDVPLLARHFLAKYNLQFGRSLAGFAPPALAALARYDWPGNVRELEHVVEQAVILSEEERLIQRQHLDLPAAAADGPAEGLREAKARAVADFERNYIHTLLLAHGGNVTAAARAARKDRKSFWELMRHHRIDAASFRQ